MVLVRAYAEVSSCRTIGMGMGPIPITAMWEWCDRQLHGLGLEPSVAAHVVRVLRIVDSKMVIRLNAKG
jgi:hypothetical protein